MYKVLIVGIKSNYLLEEMGKLSERYEIVGYADYEFECATKTYCYKPFYYMDELKNAVFDYVIVLEKNKVENERKCKACYEAGIKPENVIPYYLWGGSRKKGTFF